MAKKLPLKTYNPPSTYETPNVVFARIWQTNEGYYKAVKYIKWHRHRQQRHHLLKEPNGY